jgi:hypothetical protein
MIAFTFIVIKLWQLGLQRIKQHHLKDRER